MQGELPAWFMTKEGRRIKCCIFYADLLRNKARAQESGNLKEEARACGQLGEQYTEDG